VLPAGSAVAAPAPVTISITGITASGDVPWQPVANGGTMDVATQSLQISVDKSIDTATIDRALTVTNSKGEHLSWPSGMSGYTGYARLNIHSLLTAGETYTVTLIGGPDGLLTSEGAPMAGSLTFTLHAAISPFVPTGVEVFSKSMVQLGTVPDGGTIPRDTTELRLAFSRNLLSFSSPNVTVTDSYGQNAGWKAGIGTGNIMQFQIPAVPLPENETYTITVKGGANGVLSEAGFAFPQDVTYTLHTDDKPARWSVDIETNRALYGEAESEFYQLKAAPGTLTLETRGWQAGASGVVTLTDAGTGAVLLNKVMSNSDTTASVVIPAKGDYVLGVQQALCDFLLLSGMNLQGPTVTPAIKLPAMKAFETHNEPFQFAAGLYNPGSASSVQVQLNGQPVGPDALQGDGSVAPVTIDPTKLADGIYKIRVMAVAKDEASMALHTTNILVDRVGTFADLPADHWARSYVQVLYYLKVINGRDATHFAPGDHVTRAEFAKMTSLLLGLKPSATKLAFADVPDDWSQPYLQAMYEEGLLKGDVVGGQTYLYPSRPISRAEAATILGRVLTIADGTAPATSTAFTDYAQVPTWARASVLVLSGMKWINGFPDGSFGPAGQLQRDQAARILANFVGMH
jgi:hypothetical protein